MYNSSSLANAPVSVLPHEIPMRCYPVVRRRCIDPLNNSARGARWTASSQMADHIRRGVARWAGCAGAAGSYNIMHVDNTNSNTVSSIHHSLETHRRAPMSSCHYYRIHLLSRFLRPFDPGYPVRFEPMTFCFT